jgi:beta-phosphoglucomutase
MINAIIFDLDGVIVHTDRYHYVAWKKIADSIGAAFDEHVNNRLRGVSRMESLETILQNAGLHLSETEKEILAAEKNQYYVELLGQMTAVDVTDEIRATLESLRKLGLKTAIGSSSKNARTILQAVKVTDCFDAVSDGNNITKSKPDPEVFLKAAEYLCVRPEDCVVVEDAVSGVEAGKRAGMLTIAIGDAAKNRVGDFNIQCFGEILEIAQKLTEE